MPSNEDLESLYKDIDKRSKVTHVSVASSTCRRRIQTERLLMSFTVTTSVKQYEKQIVTKEHW